MRKSEINTIIHSEEQGVIMLTLSNDLGDPTCVIIFQKDVSDMHLGHKNVPTSKGGNLAPVNVDLEGASCNLSAGNSGFAKDGKSCAERGSCGAPYGR